MSNVDASPGRENSDETTKRNDDVWMNWGRSFRCSFCKRGFPNAQALGGHMNIHRKDRAKLKDFSDQNLLSLGITKTLDNSPADPSTAAVSRDKIAASKHNSVRSLQLFAEISSGLISDDDDDDDDDDDEEEKHSEKSKMESIHAGAGVDLELRLGHESHDAKINQ